MNETTSLELSTDALRAGDRAEFARLVGAYSAQVYRLALKMLGNPTDAEDVLQNTFLKAFQHLPTFEARSSLATWLYRIAANEALMMLRKQRPEISVDEADESSDETQVPLQLTDWCCLPEQEFVSAEARRQLDRAIQKLPEKLRVVFLLRDIEGLSIKEAGDALGLTETAVKTRLLRARLHLRESLSDYFTERLSTEAAND